MKIRKEEKFFSVNSPFGSIAHDATQQVPPITNKKPIRPNLNLGLSNKRSPIDVPIISAPPETQIELTLRSNQIRWTQKPAIVVLLGKEVAPTFL